MIKSRNVLVVKHILNLEIGGYQRTWFLKYVSTDQDHFQMEHGIKTGEKIPAYFHVTDMACVRRIKELKARKIGKGDIYVENKLYFELTTKHIKYLQYIQHWNFIKNARSNTKQ